MEEERGDTSKLAVLDLATFANRPGVEVQIRTTETPEEQEVRLRQLEKDAAFHRWRDGALFAVCLIATIVLGYICVGIVLSATASPDDKKWATSLITLVTGGIVGYLTGKSRS